MSKKIVQEAWTFRSDTSSKSYQTLLYSDGTTSCNCPGWTRRTGPNGQRSCKHTRSVDMGMADDEAVAHVDYGKPVSAKVGKAMPAFAKASGIGNVLRHHEPAPVVGKRVFHLD